jgi:hypothetical protein
MPRNIFISHKVKDRVAAEEIRSGLSLYGGGSLNIFVSERIEAGVIWSQEIREHLKKANWLILLYTDPSEEWDWCLFEAGFFAGCAEDEKCRLVCLHTMDVAPPSPLQRWQSVPVTDGAQLEKFLKELYVGINPELISSPEMLRTLADKIGGALSVKVRRKVKSYWNTKYVTISMNAEQIKELKETGRTPAGALCGLKESESLNIFGHGTEECTMHTLEQGLHKQYKEMWLKSLGDCLKAASQNKRPIPKILPLYSPSQKKDFHVILHCLDKFSDGSYDFYLLFVEKMPENEEAQGRQLRNLGNMLKLGRSFRWKVLTKYRRELSILKTQTGVEQKIEECLEKIGWSMDWVIGESQRLDILTPEDVLKIFKDEEAKQKISDSLTKVWPQLFVRVNEGIKAKDINKVFDALDGMLKANKEYMILAAGRYQELLQEM